MVDHHDGMFRHQMGDRGLCVHRLESDTMSSIYARYASTARWSFRTGTGLTCLAAFFLFWDIAQPGKWEITSIYWLWGGGFAIGIGFLIYSAYCLHMSKPITPRGM